MLAPSLLNTQEASVQDPRKHQDGFAGNCWGKVEGYTRHQFIKKEVLQ